MCHTVILIVCILPIIYIVYMFHQGKQYIVTYSLLHKK